MEPTPEEKCICQICTCGRHRCRKHPQQATLEIGPVRKSAELLMSSSLATNDYAVRKPAERPVIKKLVDNLQVSGGTLEAKPSLRTDYPEFEVKRPVIHRLTDQLKTSGVQSSEGEFATSTLSRDQYRPFSVKRPEGGRKLRSSLKVRGHLDAVSTSRSQYQDHENYARPIIHRIPDSIKLEGDVVDKSVSNADFRQFTVERPTIRRLTSSLKIAPGSMEQNQSLSQATYKEMPVSRPKRHLLADQITAGQGEMSKAGHMHDDYRQFIAERPVIKKLQDNLAIPHLAKFADATADYPEHADYAKPIRKKMEDTLKFSGTMEQASQSRKDYVEFHAERPIIKKLVDNIPVHPTNGAYYSEVQQSTQRDYGQVESKRPIINKLHDNLKMEGDVDLQTAYQKSYVQQAEPARPEIKRMHSTLAIASGDFATESVIKADFPEHRVQRPMIAKPVGQLQSNDASWGNGIKPAGARRQSQQPDGIAGIGYFQSGPSMNRIRQMESSIQFGSGVSPAMMSEAQAHYTNLEGAQKSQMIRPRTSNRLQDWNVSEPAGRNRHNVLNANNQMQQQQQQQQQPMMTRDQVAQRKKHQVTDSSLPINQPGQPIDMDGSLYKKSFTLPAIEPCPAAVLHVDEKSNYQFTRELHNHRFYKPINSLA